MISDDIEKHRKDLFEENNKEKGKGYAVSWEV